MTDPVKVVFVVCSRGDVTPTGQTDRETDREADGSQHYLMSPIWGHNIPQFLGRIRNTDS